MPGSTAWSVSSARLSTSGSVSPPSKRAARSTVAQTAGRTPDGLLRYPAMRYSSYSICAVALLGLLSVGVPANTQSKMPRVGVLLTGSPSSGAHSLELHAFMKQLGELGWVEGKNIVVDQRWAERADQFPELAAELVRTNASVILAPGPEATRAATAATLTTPIVMIASADPRTVGVSSTALPGGHPTMHRQKSNEY